MEEADYLADKIVVIDNGQVIAEGTADSLKKRVGSDRLEIAIASKSGFEKAQELIDGGAQQIDEERQVISIGAKGGVKDLTHILNRLQDAHIEVESVSLHRPTLDDVFLSLTGHKTQEEKSNEQHKKKEKK
jgi:ABC-2 type transport system ATP-binding protein